MVSFFFFLLLLFLKKNLNSFLTSFSFPLPKKKRKGEKGGKSGPRKPEAKETVTTRTTVKKLLMDRHICSNPKISNRTTFNGLREDDRTWEDGRKVDTGL